MPKTNLKNKGENKNDANAIDDLELAIDGSAGFDDENGEEDNDDIQTETAGKDKPEGVLISKTKIVLAKKLLENIRENNDKLMRLLSGSLSAEDEARISIGQMSDENFNSAEKEDSESGYGRIVEGVFDGENMIGPDGKQYSVPANYASKSKLVEGDILKLTITPAGTFVYKQIGPIDRSRVIGQLEQGETGSFTVVSEGKKWRVLTASVTYYKGKAGDEVVIMIPKTGQSQWAAVDNIVRSK